MSDILSEQRIALGKEITTLRELRGLSISDLSRISGIERANLSKIESGKYNATIELLSRLLKCLGARLVIREKQI